MKVALCIIAKDEASYAEEFMQKVSGFFDKVVVGVDTHTIDSTWDEFAERGKMLLYMNGKTASQRLETKPCNS